MAWKNEPLPLNLVTQLLTLKFRAERLALAHKIDLAEAQAKTLGTSLPVLSQIKKALAVQKLPVVEESFLRIPSSQPQHDKALANIQVVSRKGSVF